MNFPDTMKAVQLTGHGGLDKLVYREDVPVPRPAEGEVLIRVSACGMNNTDVWVREGTGKDFLRLPDYIEQKKIRRLLDRTFRLSDVYRAQTEFMAKKYIGKLVVVPDSLWEEKGAAYAGD